MEFEQKLQPLLAIAQLQCGAGTVLAWSGSAWECTKTIHGGLTITGDLTTTGNATSGNATITGDVTIGQALTVTGATVRFGTTPMTYSRASFTRIGTKIQYFEEGTLRQELDIGDGTQTLGGGASAYVQYVAGGAGGDAALLFNIEGLRTVNCTLLHNEDDAVAYGLAFATDAGNGYASAWGGIEKPTFVLSRQGRPAHVILESNNYGIACF